MQQQAHIAWRALLPLGALDRNVLTSRRAGGRKAVSQNATRGYVAAVAPTSREATASTPRVPMPPPRTHRMSSVSPSVRATAWSVETCGQIMPYVRGLIPLRQDWIVEKLTPEKYAICRSLLGSLDIARKINLRASSRVSGGGVRGRPVIGFRTTLLVVMVHFPKRWTINLSGF